MEIVLDVNLVLRAEGEGEALFCRHCGHRLCDVGQNLYDHAVWYTGNPAEAGSHIWPDPSQYIDASVQFRQFYCPGCFTALKTEIVPEGSPIRAEGVTREGARTPRVSQD